MLPCGQARRPLPASRCCRTSRGLRTGTGCSWPARKSYCGMIGRHIYRDYPRCIFRQYRSEPVVVGGDVDHLGAPGTVGLHVDGISSGTLRRAAQNFSSRFEHQHTATLGIVGLPPIVRFIGIEFAIECSHSGIGFLTVLVIIQVLRVEQEFVFALRIGRIVVPCPLIIVGPLCQQHVKLHVGSFFCGTRR